MCLIPSHILLFRKTISVSEILLLIICRCWMTRFMLELRGLLSMSPPVILGLHCLNWKERGNYKAFSGRTPSFLTDLLQKNGYYIQTGYSDSYFGATRGEYVDRYIYEVVDLKFSLICVDEMPLLGVCSELSRTIYKNWFRDLFKQPRKR